MPFNTRNPIPSGDLRDLDDNARNIDTWANDKTKLSHPDRFGVERYTWHGIEQKAQLNIQQAIDAKNAAQEAAMMSGFSKYADTLAQLESGIGTDYIEGDVVMVFQDESRGGTSSIYKVESGAAEFKLTFEKTRQDLMSFTGNISADAEWSDVPAHSDPAFDVQAQALTARTNMLNQEIAKIKESTAGVVNATDGFGIDFSGESNSLEALQAAAAAAAAAGALLQFPYGKRVKLQGSADLIFNSSVDFNFCTLDTSEFSGVIRFVDAEPWVEYLPGSTVVDNLRAAGTMSGYSWAGWWDVPEVNDSFVRIETNQAYYTYRGAVSNRQEFNVISRFGVADSALKYPLDPTKITRVWVKKFTNSWRVILNLNVDVGSHTAASSVVVSSNMTLLDNWKFTQTSETIGTTNPTLLMVLLAARVYGRNIQYQWPIVTTATTGYSYDLSLSQAYDVHFEGMRGYGDGWGATGSNLCQKVSFSRCALSRVDFHQPFMEYLRLVDCQLGSWGVLVTALGDLTLTRCSFNAQQQRHRNNIGFIRSREDTGGFCDGDIILDDCTIYNGTGTRRPLIQHQSSAGNPKPEGSPITYCFWRNVTLRACRASGDGDVGAVPRPVRADVALFSTLSLYDCERLLLDSNGDLSGFSAVTDPIITVVGSRMPYISFNALTAEWDAHLTVVNSTTGQIEFATPGTCTVVGGVHGGLDAYSGGIPRRQVSFTMFGGRINHTGQYNVTPFNGVDLPGVSMSLFGVDIRTTKSVAEVRYRVACCRVSGCTLTTPDGTVNQMILTDVNTNTPITGFSGIYAWNSYTVITGFDSLGTTRAHQVNIGPYPTPLVAADGTYTIYKDTSGSIVPSSSSIRSILVNL